MLEKLINSIELVLNQFKNIKEKEITNEDVLSGFARNNGALRQNEQHYDIISALSNQCVVLIQNGAVYWLARMIAGGEDEIYREKNADFGFGRYWIGESKCLTIAIIVFKR